ncbi:hypothetical protein LEG77_23560, partial [Salmonella enterica]|nr:hypothetical protein [Salmonella enterica]
CMFIHCHNFPCPGNGLPGCRVSGNKKGHAIAQPVNKCQMTSGGVYPAFDIVKSPKVTTPNMEN